MDDTKSSRGSMGAWAGSLLLAVATAGWAPGLASAAWDGTQQLVVGDKASAMLVESPGVETHFYRFYAPDQTTLTVSWKADQGLVLEVSVLDPSLAPLDIAAKLKGKKIRRLELPGRGNYAVRVRATSGSGRYTVQTTASYAADYGDKKIDTPESGDYARELGMPAGTKLKASVKKSKGSAATPTIHALDGPRGAVDLGVTDPTSIKQIPLAATGLYRLAIAGGNGAPIDLVVKPKVPVGHSSFRFDAMDTTPGTAEPIRAAWLTSAHADLPSEPFSHWNDDTPAMVPKNCAKCHSGLGYRDFLGVLANPDATPPETEPSSNLDDPAPSPGQGQIASGPWPVGTPVNCDTCHNSVTASLTEVTFPSGRKVTGLGDESRCMVCHQGRESTVSVEKKISDAYAAATDPITSDDTVSPKVSFLNVHYFAAAGSLYGREAETAYEYPDPANTDGLDPVTGLPPRKPYDAKFAHVASKDVCFECHDQHSLKVRVTDCAGCHVNRNGLPIVVTAPTTDEEYKAAIDNLHDVRMAGTVNDFDGDGDTREGVFHEIRGLGDRLYVAIRAYARQPKTDATGASIPVTPIAYSASAYPYFFVDPNDNGVVDPGETTQYNAWTARLLRAAYDYQYVQKDPGAFAHNAKYLIELLYDALADLNSVAPVADFDTLVRNDSGHFDTSAEAYRHWDEDTDHLVDPSCSRCHSPEGFLFRVKYGIDQTIPASLSSGMTCETCHATGANFSPLAGNKPARRYVRTVTFPVPATATSPQISAVTITNGDEGTDAQDDSFLCMTCHQGRESTLTVNAANPTPVATFTLNFRNVHYLAAGATLYGSKAAVGYQYNGKTYVPPWAHTGTQVNGVQTSQCRFCHMQNGSHSFEPEITPTCANCHGTVTFDTLTPPDFAVQHDWDNNPATKSKAEVAAFADRLYAQIKVYCAAAADNVSPPTGASYCVYNGAAYPYWYKDTDKDGIVDPGETTAMKFDSKGLRAAYNYQYYQKEPGAWAHNNSYIIQLLFDSIEDLGGDTTGLTRP